MTSPSDTGIPRLADALDRLLGELDGRSVMVDHARSEPLVRRLRRALHDLPVEVVDQYAGAIEWLTEQLLGDRETERRDGDAGAMAAAHPTLDLGPMSSRAARGEGPGQRS
jgi:hypothetical protein